MRTPVLILIVCALAPGIRAHCDTLDGPVALDARLALDKGDVAMVLKWVRAADEAAVRDVFARTLKVRALGADARELADAWFLEAVVRLHRASEGMPFTGVKSAGTIPPPIAAADRALAGGSVDELADEIARHVADGLKRRFEHARAAKRRADESVEAGRAYVAAYVAYVHYVEALHAAGAEEHHHD